MRMDLQMEIALNVSTEVEAGNSHGTGVWKFGANYTNPYCIYNAVSKIGGTGVDPLQLQTILKYFSQALSVTAQAQARYEKWDIQASHNYIAILFGMLDYQNTVGTLSLLAEGGCDIFDPGHNLANTSLLGRACIDFPHYEPQSSSGVFLLLLGRSSAKSEVSTVQCPALLLGFRGGHVAPFQASHGGSCISRGITAAGGPGAGVEIVDVPREIEAVCDKGPSNFSRDGSVCRVLSDLIVVPPPDTALGASRQVQTNADIASPPGVPQLVSSTAVTAISDCFGVNLIPTQSQPPNSPAAALSKPVIAKHPRCLVQCFDLPHTGRNKEDKVTVPWTVRWGRGVQLRRIITFVASQSAICEVVASRTAAWKNGQVSVEETNEGWCGRLDRDLVELVLSNPGGVGVFAEESDNWEQTEFQQSMAGLEARSNCVIQQISDAIETMQNLFYAPLVEEPRLFTVVSNAPLEVEPCMFTATSNAPLEEEPRLFTVAPNAPLEDGLCRPVDVHGVETDVPIFGEDEDDEEVCALLFREMNVDNHDGISREEVLNYLNGIKCRRHAEIIEALEQLARDLPQSFHPKPGLDGAHGTVLVNEKENSSQECTQKAVQPSVAGDSNDGVLSLAAFTEVFKNLPRARGERVKWARSLGLEGELARHIPIIDPWDTLKALKCLDGPEVNTMVEHLTLQFVNAVTPRIRVGVRKLVEEEIKGNWASTGGGGAQAFVNSKFVMDGAFMGRFATLEDFYKGPEELIGVPNPRIYKGCEQEHTLRHNAHKKFTTSNYGITTSPALEWEFVVNPRLQQHENEPPIYPHTPANKCNWPLGCGWKGDHGREVVPLDKFLKREMVHSLRTSAKLTEEEIICLRLYTGPMFVLYNASLRGFPEKDFGCLRDADGAMNRYETTIFAIASAVTKISKVTKIPADRKLYRGLGGMLLPEQFWRKIPECLLKISLKAPSTEGAELALEMITWNSHYNQHRSAVGAAGRSNPMRSCLAVSIRVATSGGTSVGIDKMWLNLGEAWASKAQLVDAVVEEGEVKISLSVQVSKAKLNADKVQMLLRALEQLCSAQVKVEANVVGTIDKPEDFRGGVEFGLLSTTTDRTTAVAYSGTRDQRGTIFEIMAGRIDVGASIKVLSQYPSEEEFLMPPLSCIEVASDPRVEVVETRACDSKGQEVMTRCEVVVVPVRVNVNLKAVTTEDLVARRKGLHQAMAKNLREDLQSALDVEVERLTMVFKGRKSMFLEYLFGANSKDFAQSIQPFVDPSSVCFESAEYLTCGVPSAGLRNGRVYWEIEIIEAVGTLFAGFAGACIQSCDFAGSDEKAWTIGSEGKFHHHSLSEKSEEVGLGNTWFQNGGVLCLALDLSTGCLSARSGRQSSGNAWIEIARTKRASKVLPGREAGPFLFPVITGSEGAKVKVILDTANTTQEAPTDEYRSVADVIAENALQGWTYPLDLETTNKLLQGLRVAPRDLMGEFEEIQRKHVKMEGIQFNDDNIYKEKMIEVMECKVGIAAKLTAVVHLMCEGAEPTQLGIVSHAPSRDFLKWQDVGEACGKEYQWSAILGGWFDFCDDVVMPLDVPPCQAGLLWAAILSPSSTVTRVQLTAGQSTTTMPLRPAKPATKVSDGKGKDVAVGDVGGFWDAEVIDNAVVIDNLDLKTKHLQYKKFEAAIVGFFHGLLHHAQQAAAAKDAGKPASEPRRVQRADLRHVDYERAYNKQLMHLAQQCCAAGVLGWVNGLDWRKADEAAGAGCKLETDEGDSANGVLRRMLQRDNKNLKGKLGSLLSPMELTSVVVMAGSRGLERLVFRWEGLGASDAGGVADGLIRCTSLKELDFSHNSIGVNGCRLLSKTFSVLRELIFLNLSNNGIGAESCRALSTGLGRLSKLEHLDLSDNCIGNEDSGVSSVIEALARLSSLRQIDLRRNRIGAKGWEVLADPLSKLKSLEEVNGWSGYAKLRAGGLSELPAGGVLAKYEIGVVLVVKLLEESNATLLRLDLSNNNIGAESCDALIVKLKGLNVLEHLDLSGNSLGGDGCRVVMEALVSLPHLVALDLSNNNIEAKGCSVICAALKALSFLSRLNLSNNGIGTKGCDSLRTALSDIPGLEHLDLSYNGIGVQGFAVLKEVLSGLLALKSLVLSNNDAGDEGVRLVSDALVRLSALQRIDIRTNRIGAQGWQFLSDALLKLESLEEVNGWDRYAGLRRGGISELAAGGMLAKHGVGVGLVVQLLEKSCATLTYLDLSNNGVGEESSESLGNALRRLTLLSHLDLSGNSLRGAGCQNVMEALESLPYFVSLDLSNNGAGDEGARSSSDALARLSALQRIDLRNNRISAQGWEAIGKALSGLMSLVVVNGWEGYGELRVGEVAELAARGVEGAWALAAVWLQRSAASLTAVDVSMNRLGDGELASLAAMRELRALTRLDLRSNSLGATAGSALHNALEHLGELRELLLGMNNLEDKGLEALAPALEKLPYITRLDLSSNSLSVGAGSTLSKVLEKLLELRELDLDINKLGDEGLEAMAPSLARLRSMTRLGLSSNSLNPTAGTTLGEALQHMDELRELRLGMNALEDKGLEALAPALKKLRYMTRLDLSSNSLRGDARKTLGLALEHLGELRELYLGVWEPPGATAWSDQLDAAYQCYNTAAQSPAFSAALASLSKLEVLHLSGNLISTHGMEELASAVKDLPLTDVDLRSNDLGLNAVDALSGLAANNDRIQRLRLGIVVCSAGRQHRNLLDTMCLNRLAAPGVCPSGLTVLDLSFCSFGSVAGELLALLIEKSTALTDVNLRGNSLTREGVVKLARALEQLVSMTALDMSGTRLKDGGTAVVAGALVRMEKMTSLDLSWNSMGATGAKQLASALVNMRKMTSLNLSNNDLSADGVVAVAGALEGMNKMTSLDLRCNHLYVGDDLASLLPALASMPTLRRLDLVDFGKFSLNMASRISNAIAPTAVVTGLGDDR